MLCRRGPLAAGTADLAKADGFRADLSVQIHCDTAVDRDHVVELGDGARIVDKFEGLDDHAGIHIDPFVEFSGSENNAGHALAALESLLLIGKLAGLIQLVVSVAAELGVHTKVLDIGQ